MASGTQKSIKIPHRTPINHYLEADGIPKQASGIFQSISSTLRPFIEKFGPATEIDFSALETSQTQSTQDETSRSNTIQDKTIRDNTIQSKNNKDLPAEYLDMLMRKRYSQNTIKTYISYIRAFKEEFKGRELDSINIREINAYISSLIHTRGISASQQNQRISAIKFYYEKVLGRKKQYYQLNRPRKEKGLPKILTVEEVEQILKHCKNLKHKCILMTLYSGGLRRSELINLKITDIDSERMLIKITDSKGNKDRYTLLSEKLLKLLRDYFRFYKPEYWLFEGQGGGQYSATSIENIFRNALKNANINKHTTPHTLRHSFATHLMDKRYGINKTIKHKKLCTSPENMRKISYAYKVSSNNEKINHYDLYKWEDLKLPEEEFIKIVNDNMNKLNSNN